MRSSIHGSFSDGLSSATLMTYDLEMPQGLLPLCADGEVEEFTLMPIENVLRSLREELPRWRPNAALVAIDFLIKRGFIDRQNEPEYEAIAMGLCDLERERAGGVVGRRTDGEIARLPSRPIGARRN